VPVPSEARLTTTRAARVNLRRLLAPLGLVPAVALVADCNLIIGAGNYQTTCGEFAFDAQGCEPCMESACCTEAEACRASPVCAPLFDCLSLCGASALECRGRCFLHNSELDAATKAMLDCQQAKCPEQCLACGTIGIGATQQCADCDIANCCAQQIACAKDATCQMNYVLGLCADPACTLANVSLATTIDTSPLLQDIVQCVTKSCSATCTTTNLSLWGCVNLYTFPPGSSATVDVTIFVTDLDNAGIDGVSIQACSFNDASCDPGVAHASPATPPMAGMYTITVPNGFDGYFLTTLAGNAPILQYPGLTLTDSIVSALTGGGSGPLLSYAMLPTAVFEQYLGLSGITATEDASTAAISVNAFDCYLNPAEGIKFTGSAGSTATAFYYTADGSPTPTLNATQADGRGGLVVRNLTGAQFTTITGTLASASAIVAEQTVVVLPGAITEIAYLYPLSQ
jgi:hypothetical protein